ncbi:hypothetical protein BDC45DRAFT_444990, partial [Circinella umbellata]
IVELIDLIQNVTLNCAAAGRILLIPEHTAQEYYARFRDGKPYLPSQHGKSPGPPPKLTKEHTVALQDFYEENPVATIKQAQQMIFENYKIIITQSSLQKHLVIHCGLTMKKLEKVSEARTSKDTITKRLNWVLHVEKENIDFDSCVFIDEASFNFHMQQTFGRSIRGTPAKAKVSNNRGVNITILGAIAAEGVVNLSLRRPQLVTSSKKKKA